MEIAKDTLKSLGISDLESEIYYQLLVHGPLSMTDIARKTGKNRTSLYSVLEHMIHTDIIVVLQEGKRQVYSAQHPDNLYASKKKALAALSDVLPEMTSLLNNPKFKPRMQYHEGIDGIKSVFLAAAGAKSKKIHAFVGIDHLLAESRVLDRFWANEFKKVKVKNGTHSQLILPDSAEGKRFQKMNAGNQRETRFLPASTYSFETEILVYDSTAAFISYTKKEEYALQIESQGLSNTLRMIFNAVWTVAY